MNDFEILPYVGVGLIRFGMTPDEVAALLGPPDFIVPDEDAPVIVHYRQDNAVQASHDARSNRLLLVSFFSPAEGIRLGENRLFWRRSSAWYDALKQADRSARQKYGITIFFRYGISVAGFQRVGNAEKSLTVFQRGQWRSDDPDLGLLPS